MRAMWDDLKDVLSAELALEDGVTIDGDVAEIQGRIDVARLSERVAGRIFDLLHIPVLTEEDLARQYGSKARH
ncbi:hypothetical protein [Asticcacaulis solisilvae]|uniref:hypothetical protein n=1 Tax=Asticcacaulis solisilvae TaxID=1217274 RepID=UPI003FD7BF26